MIDLRTPLGDEILSLVAGDQVTLSGTVYTARDEAHLRMMEEGIPFDPAGAAIYHCGPVISHDDRCRTDHLGTDEHPLRFSPR